MVHPRRNRGGTSRRYHVRSVWREKRKILLIKIKCDRGRPNCTACSKRQTDCTYTTIANILDHTDRSSRNTGARMTKVPKKKALSNGFEGPRQAHNPQEVRAYQGPTSSNIGLLSNVPYSHPSASNVFGIGSEHPFANYWTWQGGLSETITVLPDKLQADMLLERYFECVDPVYPMIHRQTFYADFEHSEKEKADAALVALIFTMLAMGTQFVTITSPRERQQTAEFYASAAHQSLRMSSYLNKASVRSMQAMVLITYFLINDNHASDGWSFAGILIRQAYAMGLHRDPNIVCPNASIFDKQVRRKLWQAVLLQDTFLTVLLSLPPSATHTDVNVDDLTDDSNDIAATDPTDTSYIRATLLNSFRNVFRTLPPIFRAWTPTSLALLAQTNKRIVRQALFLTSNYYHNVMLLHSSGSPAVPIDVKGALEAAHEAIQAFFLMFEILEAEAKVWWVFNHRAFLESMCIGNILREEERKGGGEVGTDPWFARGKADILRMIEIMRLMGRGENGSAVALTRVSVLSTYL
ncbi:hypothetical protein QTJ16_001402 [Diplocarpon rosae]|uniref:Xylanolytic transcriptional activator regulatory domain-containing protein n=1 Tax=Diplocarpon rosae TaxID=946125 RepID=A0AAD9T7L2_9HELO|nr:hypothetical protein QTJ16_001402 [Diplocarpon rosae]